MLSKPTHFLNPLISDYKPQLKKQGLTKADGPFLSLPPPFFFKAAPPGAQDLSSPTRDGIHAPCSGSMAS